MKAAIALGANLGNPQTTFSKAIEQISLRVGYVTACSSFYQTKPLFHPKSPVFNQPNYLNGAVLVETLLSPEDVLCELLSIERSLGRDRADQVRWGPRVIDLDLLFVDEIVLNTSILTLPHPEMHCRDFVLRPLSEIAPDWRHPLLRKTVRELYASIGGVSSTGGQDVLR